MQELEIENLMVGVAQLVRAPGCGPGGRGFNSLHSPQILFMEGSLWLIVNILWF